MSTLEINQAVIDAAGVYYRDLNARLRALVAEGITHIRLANVCGQRYIATDLPGPVRIEIEGTPGNDLGAFMDGPTITVNGNVQDGCANTMNGGEMVVHGRAGDILGMSMRGGSVFIRDGVGYRCAIHMKEYQDKKPLIVVGGTSQDFFGEYMAGGVAILLGLNGGGHPARFIGTGMHGGVIYVRGELGQHQVGKEVGIVPPEAEDMAVIEAAVARYAEHFGMDPGKIMSEGFTKLYPMSVRPYGKLYTY